MDTYSSEFHSSLFCPHRSARLGDQHSDANEEDGRKSRAENRRSIGDGVCPNLLVA